MRSSALAVLGGGFLPSSRVGAAHPSSVDPRPRQPYQMQLSALTWLSPGMGCHALERVVAELSAGGNFWRETSWYLGLGYFGPAVVFGAGACAADVLSCRPGAECVSCPAARQTGSFPRSSGGARLTQCALLQSAGSIPAARWGAGETSELASKLNTELKITPGTQ